MIQIGSNSPGGLQTSCRVYKDISSSNSSVLLQYSTDGGVTWKLIREHLVKHYTSARRLSVVVSKNVSYFAMFFINILAHLFVVKENIQNECLNKLMLNEKKLTSINCISIKYSWVPYGQWSKSNPQTEISCLRDIFSLKIS